MTLGDVQMQMFDVLAEATSVIAACYGSPLLDNVMTFRCQVFDIQQNVKSKYDQPELRHQQQTYHQGHATSSNL